MRYPSNNNWKYGGWVSSPPAKEPWTIVLTQIEKTSGSKAIFDRASLTSSVTNLEITLVVPGILGLGSQSGLPSFSTSKYTYIHIRS
mmetsp:Transcript_1541/g.1474  ORF Transcript_1541/g.1474 Transcript_1541/m.1474 type:complete len:87 (-) Transcript_1541:32-292(-)